MEDYITETGWMNANHVKPVEECVCIVAKKAKMNGEKCWLVGVARYDKARKIFYETSEGLEFEGVELWQFLPDLPEF